MGKLRADADIQAFKYNISTRVAALDPVRWNNSSTADMSQMLTEGIRAAAAQSSVLVDRRKGQRDRFKPPELMNRLNANLRDLKSTRIRIRLNQAANNISASERERVRASLAVDMQRIIEQRRQYRAVAQTLRNSRRKEKRRLEQQIQADIISGSRANPTAMARLLKKAATGQTRADHKRPQQSSSSQKKLMLELSLVLTAKFNPPRVRSPKFIHWQRRLSMCGLSWVDNLQMTRSQWMRSKQPSTTSNYTPAHWIYPLT
jgi:hypothetical protein